jgi:hypothetical protein
MNDQASVIKERPRCSKCGKIKPIRELNGCDPAAPKGQQYKNAYCRKIIDCKSNHAKTLIDEMRKGLVT